jgi:hypothetical protein
MRLVFHIIWVRVAPMIRRVIETLRLQKNGIAASLMDYARFNYIAQPGDEKEFGLFRDGPLRSLRCSGGLPRNSNLGTQAKFLL